MRSIAIIISVAFLFSSCAAIFSGTSDLITIRSHEKDTVFYVNAREVGRDSAVTRIKKNKNSDVILRASKKGCKDVSIPLETEFDPLTLLGILLDYGIISILIVDGIATGAWTKAAQTDYILTPICD